MFLNTLNLRLQFYHIDLLRIAFYFCNNGCFIQIIQGDYIDFVFTFTIPITSDFRDSKTLRNLLTEIFLKDQAAVLLIIFVDVLP